ncbi:MAG: sugar ABC transporter substrate-binding protein [Rhodobacterales bacterium]|nr:MAG: sugar ABC transporter substrate-binding protein [Rhodobacterales bacterium]
MLTRRTLMTSTMALALGAVVPAFADPDEALAKLQETVLSKGPSGEDPSPASDVELTDVELAKIKAMGATAAIVFHYGGNDWSRAQLSGLQTQFAAMGIELIAVTDAGAKLVFMDNIPAGFVPGTDYVSVVSADNCGNGVATAHLMAKALGPDGGEIGLVFHAADFFVTKQRYDAFKATIASDYPNITIVDEQGIGGPDFSGDAEKAAGAMLTSNPNIMGIWAVWDEPAEGVMAAARANGRADLIITTVDLGENVAISMATGGISKGLGAQRPNDAGVVEAKLAGAALLEKDAPDFVALPALPVAEDNLLEAWEKVYSTEATNNVKLSMN